MVLRRRCPGRLKQRRPSGFTFSAVSITKFCYAKVDVNSLSNFQETAFADATVNARLAAGAEYPAATAIADLPSTRGILALGTFVESLIRDQDAIIVVDAPQAEIEEPVGVLAEGNSVLRIVVAGAGELVDVCGVSASVRLTSQTWQVLERRATTEAYEGRCPSTDRLAASKAF